MESKAIIPPTLPTFGHSTVYVYPTVSPRVVVVPILTCIFGFPVFVLLVICALRYRARRARTTAKRKKRAPRDPSLLELPSGPSILASRCSNEKEPRISFKKKKTLVRFKPMPEIDLDTVVEEKSEFDAEMTASDLLTTPEDFTIPEEDTPAPSFRAYRYMGPGQAAPVLKSPLKTPHGSQGLDNVSEELESSEDLDAIMEADLIENGGDDEQPEGDGTENARDRYALPKNENRAEVSSGSSDSDNAPPCFTLSPKQVTKSPTAVHLALKKLDGVMSRRHSSPVKVNYGANKPKHSSGKVNYSYAKEEEESHQKKKKNINYDYIDRELMPDISPRSHSVKHPSRKTQSFYSKRRGESFKHKKHALSRSISHKLSSSQENVKNPDLIEMGECSRVPLGKSLSVGCSRNPAMINFRSELQVLGEKNDSSIERLDSNDSSIHEVEPSANKDIRIELDPKAICGAVSLNNGSNAECSVVISNQDDDSSNASSPAHQRSWSGSVAVHSSSGDTESPPRGSRGSERVLRPKRSWPDNRLDDICPPLPLKSPERLIGGFGFEKGRITHSERQLQNILNDYALKYRQEENRYKSHCHACAIDVDSDDERSTLV